MNITEHQPKRYVRVPGQVSYQGAFVLFFALLAGQAAVLMLCMCVDDIFHSLETWPSEIKAFAVAGLIGAVVSLSLLWLTRKIEQAKYHRSIGQNDESVERS